MKAYNINWSIDYDEVYEKLDDMTVDKAAAALEIPKGRYANMSTEERHDYAYDFFRHDPGALDEFLELPSEVEIPKDIEDLSDDNVITDWLSDTFGYCIEGYDLDTDVEKDEVER